MTSYRVEYQAANSFAVIARRNREDRVIDTFPDEESAEIHADWLREQAKTGRLAELAPTMLRALKMASSLIVLQNADSDSAPGIVLGEIRRVIALAEAA